MFPKSLGKVWFYFDFVSAHKLEILHRMLIIDLVQLAHHEAYNVMQ